MIRKVSVGVTAVSLGLLAGCGSSATKTAPSGAHSQQPNTVLASVSQTLGSAPPAITYDPALAPKGARVTVTEQLLSGNRTHIRLQVHGLRPNRMYGAHVHVKACGRAGDDAGPHYQNVKDPVTPSTNPKFANPRNEVWLDLATDARGAGSAESTVNWRFRPNGARSVVLHAERTRTEPGKAGSAGARLACVTVPFK